MVSSTAMPKTFGGGFLKLISLIYHQWLWTGGIHPDVATLFPALVSLNKAERREPSPFVFHSAISELILPSHSMFHPCLTQGGVPETCF